MRRIRRRNEILFYSIYMLIYNLVINCESKLYYDRITIRKF